MLIIVHARSQNENSKPIQEKRRERKLLLEREEKDPILTFLETPSTWLQVKFYIYMLCVWRFSDLVSESLLFLLFSPRQGRATPK